MSMSQRILKLAVPFAAVAMVALNGAAHAQPAQQTQDKPVDCKKTPEHERCKDKRP